MGDANCFGRVSWDYRRAITLGPGTSGPLLHDFHAPAMEELAGERRVHHRGIFAGAGIALRCESLWIEIAAKLADDPGNSLVDSDGNLHGLSFCASERARPLAESVAAAALVGAGIARRFGSSLSK